MDKACSTTNLQPFTGLVVEFHHTVVALEVSTVGDTLVAEITATAVELEVIIAAVDTHIIFLTQSCADSLVAPIV